MGIGMVSRAVKQTKLEYMEERKTMKQRYTPNKTNKQRSKQV